MGQDHIKTDRRFAQLEALYRLASVGGSEAGEDLVIKETLGVTREVMGCIRPALFLAEDERQEMRIVTSSGPDGVLPLSEPSLSPGLSIRSRGGRQRRDGRS